MVPLGKPSRIFHDVCAYWLTSSAGFNASTEGQHPNNIQASRNTDATKCRTRGRAFSIRGPSYRSLLIQARTVTSCPCGEKMCSRLGYCLLLVSAFPPDTQCGG